MPSKARSESAPWSPGRGIVHRVARPRFVDVAILCAATSDCAFQQQVTNGNLQHCS